LTFPLPRRKKRKKKIEILSSHLKEKTKVERRPPCTRSPPKIGRKGNFKRGTGGKGGGNQVKDARPQCSPTTGY